MNTRSIDTEKIKQDTDMREYAGHYTTLRRESARELAGPCPKCGGTKRFHCQADWFFCRDCHEKRGDIIEFVMWKDGLDFKEAVATLTNAPMPTTPATRRAPAPKRQAERPPDWQKDTDNLAQRAHWRLMDDDDQTAIAARDYLDSRGIETHTWQAFNLGYTPSASLPGTEGKERAPAIVMPWYRAGKVVAVRYRFLQWHEYTDNGGKARREKQTALSGSSFGGVLYGGQALETGIAELSTLVICEGELNAVSVWQVTQHTHVDVLSLGSETSSITPAMVEYASRYAHVVVWLDREERAQAVMAALPGAHGIKSPNAKDANDLLQAEMLGGFLAMHRFQVARNRHEQQRLLWDLWDAAQLPGGVDASTSDMLHHIAKTLAIAPGGVA